MPTPVAGQPLVNNHPTGGWSGAGSGSPSALGPNIFKTQLGNGRGTSGMLGRTQGQKVAAGPTTSYGTTLYNNLVRSFTRLFSLATPSQTPAGQAESIGHAIGRAYKLSGVASMFLWTLVWPSWSTMQTCMLLACKSTPQ
jgi:hypothetical protein